MTTISTKVRLSIGLAVLVSLFVATMSVAAYANLNGTDVKCELDGPSADGVSSDTGGTVISYAVECTGKTTLDTEVVVTVDDAAGGKTLFKAADTYSVAGNASATKEIHLPILVPTGAQVCVTVNGAKTCVP